MNNYQLAAAILTAAIAAAPEDLRRVLAVEIHDEQRVPYEGAFAGYGAEDGNEEQALRCVDVYVDDDGMWMVDRSDHTNGEVDPRPLTAAYLMAALAWIPTGEFVEPVTDDDRAAAAERVAYDPKP